MAHVMFVLFPEKGHLIPGLKLAARLAESEETAKITIVVGEVGPGDTTGAFARSFDPALSSEKVSVISGPMAYDASSFGWAQSSRSAPVKFVLSSLISDANTSVPAFKAATIGERVGRVAASLALAARSAVEQQDGCPPDVVVYETFSIVGADLAVEWGIPGVLLSSTTISSSTDSPLVPGFMATSIQTRESPPSLGKRIGFGLKSLILPFAKHMLMISPQGSHRASAGLPPVVPTLDNVLNERGHIVLETMVPPLSAPRLRHPNVFPVGPLGPTSAVTPRADDDGAEEVWAFLDSVPERSVVFVSLGSHVSPKEEAAVALVEGLRAYVEGSPDVFVLWARGSVLVSEFPHLESVVSHPQIRMEGFVPQSQILHSPAVGVFISHCGAGAIGEGVLAGVPFVAVPIALDQPSNAARAVEAGFAVGLDLEQASPSQVVEAIFSARAKASVAAHVRSMVTTVGGADSAVDLVLASARVGPTSWLLRAPVYLSWGTRVVYWLDVWFVVVVVGIALIYALSFVW